MAKSKALVPAHNTLAKAFSIVPYLTREEIKRMIAAIGGRHKTRDELLILLLYQTGLRISEALCLTPRMIGLQNGKAVLFIVGKGKKARMVACPNSLAHRLKSYAYDRRIAVDEKLFEINRKRAWQIVTQVAKGAGIQAAKRTSELIPLCHLLPLAQMTVDFAVKADRIEIRAEASTEGKTGVEMEALTAVTVAALTLYDMMKAVDKAMHIEGVALLVKEKR